MKKILYLLCLKERIENKLIKYNRILTKFFEDVRKYGMIEKYEKYVFKKETFN